MWYDIHDYSSGTGSMCVIHACSRVQVHQPGGTARAPVQGIEDARMLDRCDRARCIQMQAPAHRRAGAGIVVGGSAAERCYAGSSLDAIHACTPAADIYEKN
ncbi:hypothetical protein BS78_01G452000 [Paspalum vaginatum]|nr:hypothetical protein BS78_01G452000 [Paspalum vaginatum]